MPLINDGMLKLGQAHPRELVEQIRYYAGQNTRGVELLRFLLRHGREFINPRWRHHFGAQPKFCFQNATMAALAHGDLNYAEGFVWSNEVPMLVEHAWCVDDDRQPVEVTFRQGLHTDLRYFGVVLNRAFVENLVKGASAPFLERSRLAALDALPRDQWWDSKSGLTGNSRDSDAQSTP